jgi:hypothetical protein
LERERTPPLPSSTVSHLYQFFSHAGDVALAHRNASGPHKIEIVGIICWQRILCSQGYCAQVYILNLDRPFLIQGFEAFFSFSPSHLSFPFFHFPPARYRSPLVRLVPSFLHQTGQSRSASPSAPASNLHALALPPWRSQGAPADPKAKRRRIPANASSPPPPRAKRPRISANASPPPPPRAQHRRG